MYFIAEKSIYIVAHINLAETKLHDMFASLEIINKTVQGMMQIWSCSFYTNPSNK